MGRTVSRADLAEVFDCAKTTVDAWIKDGCPIVAEGGRGKAYEFDTGAVHRWLLARERRKSAAKETTIDPETGEERISLDEAQRRKAIADAKKAELGLLKEVGLVVPVDRIAKVVSDEIANARARLLSIPTKFRPEAQVHASSPERAKKLVSKVEDLIRDALTEIKTYGAPE